MKKCELLVFLTIIFSLFLIVMLSGEVQANLTNEDIEGVFYEFDEENDYEWPRR